MKRELPCILLADPQDASRDALSQQLEDAGFEVQTATSGIDVILLCEADPPDVLIIDVDLPDMDGFEVCEYVRRETRGSDMTIIIITEAADELTRTSIRHMVDFARGDFFFVKPFDGKLLVRLLDDLRNDSDTEDVAYRAGSPTRVVWPTTRSCSLAGIGCSA